MRIVIPGGTGQVGTLLARHFHRAGHEVSVLGRRPRRHPWDVRVHDGAQPEPLAELLDGADVVINLVGRNVNCRYDARNRREILESRVRSVEAVGRAIGMAHSPPSIWLQASTATIYAHRFDAPNDEATGILGGDEADAPSSWRFSIEVARAWERALDESDTPRTRKVKLRSAMTMSPDAGGIFRTLLRLVRLGLGGPVAGGRQYLSWIHESDFIGAVEHLIARPLEGAVNVAAPTPLPYADFMRVLRRAWGTPLGLPATKWMLEIGALVLRTESELVLKSRRVVPGRLLEDGFEFRYPCWPEAAAELCARVRRGPVSS